MTYETVSRLPPLTECPASYGPSRCRGSEVMGDLPPVLIPGTPRPAWCTGRT